MLRINQYLEPGVYRHYKGNLYVVLTVITHMDGSDGKMKELTDPLVCYRDVVQVEKHIKGKPSTTYHQVYARPLSEFFATIEGKKRFTKE
jgi:hypothetical protein